MSGRCRAIGCTTSVAEGFLMCARHWRMVPGELKRMLSFQFRKEERTPAWREAVWANIEEVCRIVFAIERGEAA